MRFIIAWAVVTLVLVAGDPTVAAVRLMKCEGKGLDKKFGIVDEKFFFKFDDMSQAVTWVQGDGLTKIKMDRIDEDHLWFTAETEYVGMPNLHYWFDLDRNSGSGSVKVGHRKLDGSFDDDLVVYMVSCQPTNKAF